MLGGCNGVMGRGGGYYFHPSLKPDSSADHSADTWTAARPRAANLALDIDAAVFIAESHATCAVISLVIGVE